MIMTSGETRGEKAVTRRERHLRIIENFGRDRERYHLAQVIARHGLTVLTDAGVEKVARSLVSGHKLQQRYNREARAKVRS
jgi:hypothetical protein